MKFSADKVALALVTACELFCEDPIKVADGRRQVSRGRVIAIEALAIAFPKVEARTIARCCGMSAEDMERPGPAYTCCWWEDVTVDEVVGALVAEQYGEQAA